MAREVCVALQPAEVDDPLDVRRGGSRCERLRCDSLALLERASRLRRALHRMDQVVRHLDLLERRREAFTCERIASHDRRRREHSRRVARKAADVVSVGEQSRNE
jgi:hypothetical protein